MKIFSKRLIAVALFICVFTIDASAKEKELDKMTFDVSNLNVELIHAKRASFKALANRKWNIKEINENDVKSEHSSHNSKIDFSDFPKIHISFIVSDDDYDDEDSDSGPRSWLIYLRRDILSELVNCSNL